jgi:hypothetical protein
MDKEMLEIVLRIRLRTIFIIVGVVLALSVVFVALSFVGVTTTEQSSPEPVAEATSAIYVSP